ncbi:MAG TPA: GNAT family N-acetyltransferase [Gemmatimonadaceae bacterium]|nr:GNAT family N-acetyltransferase [Gemmatimonadaceae bacterium]
MTRTPLQLLLRPPRPDDAGGVARLLGELGYPVDPVDVPRRLGAVVDEGGAVVLAVDRATGEAVGMITTARHVVLHAPGPVAYITALVTAAAARGRGVGRALVAEAVEWARREGCVRISVTSAEHRADAHAFYPACGLPYTGRRFGTALEPVTPGRPAR